MNIDDNLLRRINEEFRKEQIPPIQRPFLALSKLSKENSCSIYFHSPEAKKVFDWFEKNTKPESHHLGSLYKGVYFFDASFWEVSIPVAFGRFELNGLDSLIGMPDSLKSDLSNDNEEFWIYALHFANCVDYGLGYGEAANSKSLSDRTKKFLENGHREISGAVSQLLEKRPNTKAILSLRMSAEIFLKAFLIQEINITDDELKKIGHSIKKCAKECNKVKQSNDFEVIMKSEKVFPSVSDRYDGDNYTPFQAWEAMVVAQHTASSVVRFYTDRDTRAQLTKK